MRRIIEVALKDNMLLSVRVMANTNVDDLSMTHKLKFYRIIVKHTIN